MRKHLVLVGGGHAHLTLLLRSRDFVDRGIQVTLISASPYHYYSGMGPGMLAGSYRPQDIRFHIRKTVQDRGAKFIEDRVVRVDPSQRRLLLASNAQVPYDVVSFNTGSDVVFPAPRSDGSTVFPVKPVSALAAARAAILQALGRGQTDIAVIGGGPAGVEVAGNLWRLVRDSEGHAHITLITGQELLQGYPLRVQRLARRSLVRRGIDVREGFHAERIEPDRVIMTGGAVVRARIILAASGIRPSPLFRESGLPVGPDGGLLVDRYLRSPAHPEIFGGGDAIWFQPRPLAKVGVYAVRQNMVLYRNVTAALFSGEPVPFEPQQKFMLIFNLGNDRAIVTRGRFVWEGRLAWKLKDRIDRAFMKRFQVSGEVLEDE
jgi:NADH dehydrogenase FAD-containing subunit